MHSNEEKPEGAIKEMFNRAIDFQEFAMSLREKK